MKDISYESLIVSEKNLFNKIPELKIAVSLFENFNLTKKRYPQAGILEQLLKNHPSNYPTLYWYLVFLLFVYLHPFRDSRQPFKA